MKIFGLEKLSMVDFEGHLCCTVFTGGCNFRCPFCQNSDLVNITNLSQVSDEEFFAFLQKRRGVLDSVCVSGGEPTLQPDLEEFLRKIKTLGYLVKLDTNGTKPELLKDLIEKSLVDYVAMDIKNSPSAYAKTAGTSEHLTEIKTSVELLKTNIVPYEFRTTLVGGHHTEKEIQEIATWLKGSEKLFLQHFVDGGTCIESGLKEVPKSETLEFKKILEKTIKNVSLRGY